MFNAFLFGAIAQSTLLLAGFLVFWFHFPPRVVGWLAGYGAGALISAIAFSLIEQADTLGALDMTLWLILGAVVFISGDLFIEKKFGSTAEALGIVLGSLVDGVPESIIFGIQLGFGGAISPAFLMAVMVSNIPQSLAPSADLAKEGWSKWRIARMWLVVVLACGVACGLFYGLSLIDAGLTGSRASALAAGGLLAMLTSSLIPFADERGGIVTGIFTVLGFATSFLMS